MKLCPKCARSYNDESLNFCLEDGALLSRSPEQAATLLYNSVNQVDPIPPTEVLTRSPLVQSQTASTRTSWSIYLIGFLVLLVLTTIVTSVGILLTWNPSTTTTSNQPLSVTSNPTSSLEPTSNSVIDLSGSWRDAYGGSAYIRQVGKTFTMTINGTACRGRYVSTANGTIDGTRIELFYESNYSRGQCTGSTSSDGTQVTLTCADSACGQFVTSSEKIQN